MTVVEVISGPGSAASCGGDMRMARAARTADGCAGRCGVGRPIRQGVSCGEPLREVSGDGKLTAADAAFAQFKVMVTNADGSTIATATTEL